MTPDRKVGGIKHRRRCARRARVSIPNPAVSENLQLRRGNHSSIMQSRSRRLPALTSLLKPIATAPWHGPSSNRAATARRESKSLSRRQMEAGRIAAGSGRALRLDPFSLPVRFEAADEAADGRRRIVDLHRERVVLRRSVRGMRMALNMPVAALSRRRHPAVRRAANNPPIVDRGRARTRRSGFVAAAVFLAVKPTTSSPNGSRGAACWGCRFWSPKATATCANRSRDRAAAHRSADLAPPPPQRDRAAPAVSAPAPPPRRELPAGPARASRRARDHRAELGPAPRCWGRDAIRSRSCGTILRALQGVNARDMAA